MGIPEGMSLPLPRSSSRRTAGKLAQMDWGICFNCFLVVFGGPLIYAVLVSLIRAWRRHPQELEAKRRKAGLCPKCGYDLRATHGRCPECGEPVETKHVPVKNSEISN